MVLKMKEFIRFKGILDSVKIMWKIFVYYNRFS